MIQGGSNCGSGGLWPLQDLREEVVTVTPWTAKTSLHTLVHKNDYFTKNLYKKVIFNETKASDTTKLQL